MSPDQFVLSRPLVSTEQWDTAQHLAREFQTKMQAGAEFSVPTWVLLAALAELEPVVFHGTSEPAIESFLPRRSVDTNPFGAQLAVYATRDPLWAMFYSILDRNPPFSLHNGCFRTFDSEGVRSDPKYFFSISDHALRRKAFSPGFIYVLPGKTFFCEPESSKIGTRVEVDHWASLEPVRPHFTIATSPEDFPFLNQIRGHDDDVLWKRMEQDPDRFPWVDEQYQ